MIFPFRGTGRCILLDEVMGAILRRRFGPLVAACFLTLGLDAAAATSTGFLGMPLAQALQELQGRGLRFVFADNVVLPTMVVTTEPAPGTPRQVLAELLAPHALTVRESAAGVMVVVPGAAAGGGEAGERPAAVFSEELYITPSGVSILRSQPVAVVAFERSEILALPHLADDFFRSITLMPGATANDVTAHFNLRGGWRDETLVRLDGQELYEAYHLEDLDDASSFVATSSLASADLLTGGFPARYGDRMAGVLDLQTRAPDGAARGWLGVAASSFEAGGAGTLGDGGERGGWMLEARRGAIDLLARLLGDEDPSYWDAFGKLDLAFGARNSLRVNGLYADDRLRFDENVDGDFKHHDTAYRSSYLWATWRSLVTPALYVETSASASRSNRDREGVESESDAGFAIRDLRDFDVAEIGQDWSFEASARQSLSWGARLRHDAIDYDYRGVVDFDNPLAPIRHDFGRDRTVFVGEFDNDQTSAYLDDRLHFGERFSGELGVRYDGGSLGGEDLVSPRLSLAWAPSARDVVRLAWGRYTQSQRIYELQVEDGETRFAPVERSQHRVAGFERLFAGRSGVGLRIELYQREVENPRPRYGNLFESLNTFPEAEPDRVRFAPERSRAEGMEVFLRGSAGKLRWSGSYALARTRDRLDGRWAPRPFDETHAVKLDLDCLLGANWRLNLAWRFHTGWPTTPLDFVAVPVEDGGEDAGETVWVPVLGPLGSARLPDYHRLDLRASRGWQARGAAWEFFVDVQNLYDRKNVAGFDVELNDEGNVRKTVETWTGILPTAGIRVEF
jgi:TonB-dependent receptor-like protein